MFVPIGLGGSLRRFPIGTLILVGFCVFWSVDFFPEAKALHSLSETGEYSRISVRIQNLKQNILERHVDSCTEEGVGACFFETVNLFESFEERSSKRSPASHGADQDYQDLEVQEAKLQQLREENYQQYGFLSKSTFSFLKLVRATFTHGDPFHLAANLLVLVLIGVWVEQRIQGAKLLVLFLLGSFIGLSAQVYRTPGMAVLGASAGVYTIMGLFFALFFHKNMTVLFTIFPVYFKRVSLPILWTFPFFFLFTEVAAAFTGRADGVGHTAHLCGALIGLAFGFWLRFRDRLPLDCLFFEEVPLLEEVRSETDSHKSWKAFQKLMAWNPQNWSGLTIFLNRCRAQHIDIGNKKQKQWLEHRTSAYCLRLSLKREQLSLLSFCRDTPDELDLGQCLKRLPAEKILQAADYAANDREFSFASRLYRAALQNEIQKRRKKEIKSSLRKIEAIESNQKRKTEKKAA